jgi:hypothetical protein
MTSDNDFPPPIEAVPPDSGPPRTPGPSASPVFGNGPVRAHWVDPTSPQGSFLDVDEFLSTLAEIPVDPSATPPLGEFELTDAEYAFVRLFQLQQAIRVGNDYTPSATAGEPAVPTPTVTTYAGADDLLALEVDDVELLELGIRRLASEQLIAIDRARMASEAKGALQESMSGVRADHGWPPHIVARRELQSELSLRLKLPEGAVQRLIDGAQIIVADLPDTFASLETGRISALHALKIAEIAGTIPQASRRDFEREVVPVADRGSVSDTSRKARKVRQLMHPEPMLDRHIAAVTQRSLRLDPADDGMAWLTAYLAAPEALGIFNRVTEVAHALKGPDEDRTLTQLRVDAFSDLLINGTTEGPYNKGILPTVFLEIRMMTVLGHGDEPAMLEGYGPIDLDTATQLASKATEYIPVLVDPFTSAILDVGLKRRVPKEMRNRLRLRDEHCRGIGCRRPASVCEIDHTEDHQFGNHTAVDNLAFLCGRHHDDKTYTGLKLTQVGGGDLVWTSPLKRKFLNKPENSIVFRPTRLEQDDDDDRGSLEF